MTEQSEDTLNESEIERLKEKLLSIASDLKPQHLEFAKNLAAGQLQETAYKNANYKAKDATVGSTVLLNSKPKISEYVEVQKQITVLESLKLNLCTFEEKARLLWKMAKFDAEVVETKNGPRHRDGRAAKLYIEELNKMQGHLATIKIDNKTTSSIVFGFDIE
jgi:hypothetical protein